MMKGKLPFVNTGKESIKEIFLFGNSITRFIGGNQVETYQSHLNMYFFKCAHIEWHSDYSFTTQISPYDKFVKAFWMDLICAKNFYFT